MKRLSIVMALVTLIGFTSFAQVPHPQSKNDPPFTNANIKRNKLKFNETRTATDTFANILALPCDSFFWAPRVSVSNEVDSGFLCGHNTYLDSSKAEKYSSIPGDKITGLLMWFGYARSTASTQVIHVRIWNANGLFGSPGTILGSVDVPLQTIATDVTNDNLTTVYFPTAINLPAGGFFYAGFTMEYRKKQGIMVYDSTRAVAINSTYPANSATGQLNGCSNESWLNTAWEQWSSAYGQGGGWHTFYDFNGWAERNFIFPIVQTAGGCTVTITPSSATICKSKSATLVATSSSGTGTWTWAPATGLDVTNAATVVAKPMVTTTYTATNSEGCSATVTVTVNPQPGAGFTQGACSGGAVLLTRTGTPTTGVTFKWFKNNAAISGATNATFSATSTGDYKVRVTIAATGCTKTSPVQTVTVSCKLGNGTPSFGADAYPNPFAKSVSVNIASVSSEPATIQLMDLSGRMLNTFTNVDASVPFVVNENLTPGVYFIKVTQGSDEKMIKVVKSE